jgi:hypothetical protein
MIEDTKHRWGFAPLSTQWICPECDQVSNVSDWRETTVGCEDCGEHDARECPLCHERLDIVYDDARIKAPDTKDVSHV